jgi:hypothetical protein
VNDVKLAISTKAYQSFTRPLPVSILKQIAQEKNSVMELPKFEEPQPAIQGGTPAAYGGAGGIMPPGVRGLVPRPPKLDDILPKQEYRMTNPNI